MATEQYHPIKVVNKSEPHEMHERTYAIGLERRAQDSAAKANISQLNSANPHILIVSEDDAISEVLEVILCRSGLASERARSMVAGCECARSGRFQVVVTNPMLSDGTWRRLTNLATRYRPGFVVIVVAATAELKECAEAIEEGAFDVIDASHELPKVGEAVRRALWVAYLEGGGPRPGALRYLEAR